MRRQTISPALRREVIATWGDQCWLGLPGCTGRGEEDDHIVPWSHGGRDTLGNLRRACKHCNSMRSDRNVQGYPCTYHAVIGPPCAGKTEWALEHARADSLLIDFGMLATALTMPDMHEPGLGIAPDAASTAGGAWTGALHRAERLGTPGDVWVVRCVPQLPRHPRLLDEWIALGWDVTVVDPGEKETLRRIGLAGGDVQAITKAARAWYGLHLTARHVQRLVAARRDELARLGLADRTPPAAGGDLGGW